MKLNPNCIRDILLYLEENLELSSKLEYILIDVHTIADALSYPLPEVVNTLVVLNEAGFLYVSTDYAGNKIIMCDVVRLTYKGYQFLETIRPKTIWEKVIGICTKFGSFSLDFIARVATQIAVGAIPTLLT